MENEFHFYLNETLYKYLTTEYIYQVIIRFKNPNMANKYELLK